MIDPRIERISTAAEYVAGKLGGRKPFAGIVLGSGLGKLADKIEDPVVIPYKEIPGFPVSTAVGHKGNFIAGTLGGKFVIAMQGRFHYYEGYPMELVTLPVRVMKVLGIGYLFVSNAAGGVNFDFRIGDLMIIRDHINLLPNPLVGKNMDEFGPRFPDMTRPYDPALVRKAEIIGADAGIELKKGVYLAGTGPSYETPSEYKYFRLIGADAVGMSTIPEVIVARHMSIPVFGMSVITNEAHDDYADDYENNGDDVVAAADAAADRMTLLFSRMIESL
ncbi:MAG: purine nucleoside phosphorylase I, inosine and guanosine-specific [Bacteroidetes bacterium]|uniref:Purine nucleoside phosphorylase n=1 Tax=Candidatus Cryptobacteroides faecavium TaxID=2840762 RepID=A0A9D9NEQ3_9BACT|nr:purine nucleoside phosphorylase I, inosine and guanosine-specific [Candidatus Cryptobacteroides faecavium]